MIKTTLIAFLLAAGMGFIANRQPPVTGTSWRLVRILPADKKTEMEVGENLRAFLLIAGDTFKGYSGCNDYAGRCTATKDSIVFNLRNITKKHCPGLVHDIEARLCYGLLSGTAKQSRIGDTLLLTSAKSQVFKFVKQKIKLPIGISFLRRRVINKKV